MASPLQNVVSENLSDLYSRSKELAGEAAERSREVSKELLGEMKDRLPDNTPALLGLAAAGVAVGLAGYLLGKSRRPKTSKETPVELLRDTFENPPLDFTPLYKLVKLWMLYRIAV